MARIEIRLSDRVGNYSVKDYADGSHYESEMNAPKLTNAVYRRIFDQILKTGSARVEITSIHDSDHEKAIQERIESIDEKYSDDGKDYRERQFMD